MQKIQIACLCMILALLGCETESDLSYVSADAAATGSSDTGSSSDSGDSSSGSDTSSSDGFSYGAVIWGGESYAGASTVDLALHSADVSGGYIRFEFDMNDSWPLHSLGDGNVQAVACMFMKRADGSWYGGKFDWIAVGGQSVKLTENIDNGYGAFASEKPTAGQTVAFMWISTDKTRRSNEAITTWE